MSNLPENGRIGNAAALASIDAKPGTRIWVDVENCNYVAVPTGNAASNAVTGPTDPEPISWQPDGVVAIDPSGAKAAASKLDATRANRAVGGGVQLASPELSIPTDAQLAAGLAALQAGVLYCSSTDCTVTSNGIIHTLTSWTPGARVHVENATLTRSGIAGVSGQLTAVRLVPNNGITTTGDVYPTWASEAYAGKRTRIQFAWRPYGTDTTYPNAGRINLQIDWRQGAGDTAAGVSIVHSGPTGAFQVLTAKPSDDGVTTLEMWERADGWCVVNIEYTSGPSTHILLTPKRADGSAFDGTIGIDIDGFRAQEVTCTAAVNLSTANACTITEPAATAPWLDDDETGLAPGHGWIDGSVCWKFAGEKTDATRKLSISSAGYNAIGAASGVCLTMLLEPYEAQATAGYVWNFTGSTAVLRCELTSANVFTLTRTNDAGATVTASFTTYVGCSPCAYSIDLDGTSARLYRQGELVETIAFAFTGATTFTAGAFGGGIKARVAAIAASASSLSAATILTMHSKLAFECNWTLDEIDLWLLVGQSNSLHNAASVYLPNFGAPSNRRRVLQYLSEAPSAGYNVGWGRSRALALLCRSDSPSWTLAHTESGNIGPASGFLESATDAPNHRAIAVVQFGVGGSAVTSFITGGGNNAAMLAALDDAVAKLGLPYKLRGLIYVGGEQDCALRATAVAIRQNLETLRSELNTRYGDGSEIGLVIYRIHQQLSRDVADNSGRAILEACRRGQDSVERLELGAVATIDDKPMRTDFTHLGGDAVVDAAMTQRTLGQRLAAAARRIGLL